MHMNTLRMLSRFSKRSQRMLVFLSMLLGLTAAGAIVYFLLDQNNHDGVMIVSTVTPVIAFVTSTWLYLRINWVAPDVFAQDADPSKMAQCKWKVLAYVAFGFLLGVPAVYLIMHGVRKDMFTTVFPLAYIIVMSVVSMAFLPGFLKTTRAIAPVRYIILTVALFVILLKVGVYLNSYFPGNLNEFVTKNLFFALGCGNIFLLFLLHAAWHQVFTMDHIVATPLNDITRPNSTIALNQTPTQENDERKFCIVDVPVHGSSIVQAA